MTEQPTSDQIPTDDGGYQIYKAAGKLQGKKAVITGGDSGIGRAIAILYAMEGAESLIAYLPDEERDAKDTQRLVEERGGKLHLLPVDLRDKGACKSVVEMALQKMGTINILVNNAGTQTMKESIDDISEYVSFFCHGLADAVAENVQGAMGADFPNQHPSVLLPVQIRPAAHEEGRYHYKLCFN